MLENNAYSWHATDPSGECLRLNSAGVQYEEFSCLYPLFGKMLFPFELTYDTVPVRDAMRNDMWTPIFACALYFAFIVAGRNYFENRPAWNFRKALAVWNFSLAVFSAWGFSRMFPHMIHNFYYYSWKENLCIDPETNVGCGSVGVAAQFFVLSKFPELVDTVFIVIHKKPLIFLHWYHHVSVLLFCWFGYIHNPPTGIIFSTMNYGVHAVMYFYYFLMAIHCKPKWFKPIWITIVQIAQMVVGCTVTAAGCYLLLFDKPEGCSLTNVNILPSLVMYGSYLILFVQFFFARYKVDVKRSHVPKKKAA